MWHGRGRSCERASSEVYTAQGRHPATPMKPRKMIPLQVPIKTWSSMVCSTSSIHSRFHLSGLAAQMCATCAGSGPKGPRLLCLLGPPSIEVRLASKSRAHFSSFRLGDNCRPETQGPRKKDPNFERTRT